MCVHIHTHTDTHILLHTYVYVCIYLKILWCFSSFIKHIFVGHRVKVGDYSMACMILPCGAYCPWVGDRSKQSKQNNYKLLCGKCFKENKQDTELEERGHCGQGSGWGRPWVRVNAVCFISDLYQYLMLRISVICTGILTVFIFKILFL